jgi:hypothetical protein
LVVPVQGCAQYIHKQDFHLTHFVNASYNRDFAVAHLVEALGYKTEGRGFDSRWCQWNFSLKNPSGRTMTQPVTEMSTRNIFLGVRAAGA